jgi:hypothetical protein
MNKWAKLNVGGVEVTITQMKQSLTYVSPMEGVPSLEEITSYEKVLYDYQTFHAYKRRASSHQWSLFLNIL